SGKVTLEGKPLNATGVVISFVGKDGRPVTTEVGRDGNYVASGVLVGEVTVLVSWNPPADQDPAYTSKPKDKEIDPKTPPAAPHPSPAPPQVPHPGALRRALAARTQDRHRQRAEHLQRRSQASVKPPPGHPLAPCRPAAILIGLGRPVPLIAARNPGPRPA